MEGEGWEGKRGQVKGWTGWTGVQGRGQRQGRARACPSRTRAGEDEEDKGWGQASVDEGVWACRDVQVHVAAQEGQQGWHRHECRVNVVTSSLTLRGHCCHVEGWAGERYHPRVTHAHPCGGHIASRGHIYDEHCIRGRRKMDDDRRVCLTWATE